jgi:hypothetical protein
MTAKQAMISRCLDCCVAFMCDLDCPLLDLVNLKVEVNWIGVTIQYCRWCKNRNPGKQCACQGCAINKFQTKTIGNNYIDFLPRTTIVQNAKLQEGTNV